MAIASRIKDNEMVVVERLSFAAPKTRQMAGTLQALGLAGVSTLVATAQLEPHVYRSARNIPGVTVSPVSDLNALAVLSPQKVVVTREALDLIIQRSQARSGGSEAGSAAAT
jgi:large subunit ribosomal protein L4